MGSKEVSVLVVDDSADITELLRTIIEGASGMRCAGTLTRADTLAATVQASRPDVVLLDLTMPGKPPLEALRETLELAPETRTLLFTGYDDPETVEQGMDAGAWGLISKNEDPQAVVEAIRRVAEGELWVP